MRLKDNPARGSASSCAFAGTRRRGEWLRSRYLSRLHQPRPAVAGRGPVSAELGPKPEHEIRSTLEREVDAERWTRLDVAIRMAADDTGFLDLRPDQHGADDPEVRRLALGRLQKLERMGLV
jgi:hypothetical protein